MSSNSYITVLHNGDMIKYTLFFCVCKNNVPVLKFLHKYTALRTHDQTHTIFCVCKYYWIYQFSNSYKRTVAQLETPSQCTYCLHPIPPICTLCTCMHISACVCVYLGMRACQYVCMYTYVCMLVFVCIYTYLCMVFVFVGVYLFHLTLRIVCVWWFSFGKYK